MTTRPIGCEPSSNEDVSGSHQVGTMLQCPSFEIWMTKTSSLRRTLHSCVEADPDRAAGNLVTDRRVVARRDEERIDWDTNDLGLAKEPVLPDGRGEDGGKRGRGEA